MPAAKYAAIALVAVAVTLGLLLLGVALAHAGDLGLLAESIFDRLDADNDGVISGDEIKAARSRMFDGIDADHDGFATAAEIQAARDAAQKRRSRRLANIAKLRAEMPAPGERFAALDQDGDGKLTRDEFVSVNPWFDRIDQNGGHLTKADFAKFLDAAN